MIRDIVKYGDPRLLAPNAPVDRFDDEFRQLVADLVETCHAAPGLGLAAPQVGVNLRVAIVDLSVGEDPDGIVVLVNPEVLEVEGQNRSEEGCLSIPGLTETLARPARVKLRASDAEGCEREIEGTDLLARALLHETDHLYGKLFIHRLKGIKGELVRKRVERNARRQPR
jgi:peptide deformylase